MKRYSLRSVLVGVTILTFVLGVVVLQTRNLALRREVEMYRAELGYLVPKDLSRVNLIEVPTKEQYTWKWRVYAPPGTFFDAGILSEKIPESGVPAAMFTGVEIPSKPRGVLVTASISNDLDAGYVLQMDFENPTFSTRTLKSSEEFVDGSAALTTAGQKGVEVCDFDVPIILHRRKLMEQASQGTKSNTKGSSRGVMFWMIPMKKP